MADAGTRARPSRRSRVIGALKLGLPAAALILLGAVVLWRVEDDPGIGLTFSPAQLADLKAGLKISEPQLSGASLNGDLYDFRAATVVPEAEDISSLRIDTLAGKVTFRDGREVTVTSATAIADFAARTLSLETGIEVVTSDGYTATTEALMLDLATSVLTADGGVRADGPLGRIEAEAFRLEPADTTKGLQDPLIRFTGGVTLRYEPAKN